MSGDEGKNSHAYELLGGILWMGWNFHEAIFYKEKVDGKIVIIPG